MKTRLNEQVTPLAFKKHDRVKDEVVDEDDNYDDDGGDDSGDDDIVAREPQGICVEYFPLEVPNSPLGGGGSGGGAGGGGGGVKMHRSGDVL